MKKRLLFVLAVGLFTAGIGAQSSYNPVAEVHLNKPKSGMQAQYHEEARRQHMAWHRSQKDTWTWVTWEMLAGPRAGSYVVASPGITGRISMGASNLKLRILPVPRKKWAALLKKNRCLIGSSAWVSAAIPIGIRRPR